MNIAYVQPNDAPPPGGPEVERVLAACGLPFDDLTPSHLQHFFSVRDGPQLVGVVGLELYGDVALLRSLAVQTGHRGRGIATQLLCRAEAYARAHGVEVFYLLTITAEAFFTKRGYKAVDRANVPLAIQRTTEFQSLCPASAVCLAKFLICHPGGD